SSTRPGARLNCPRACFPSAAIAWLQQSRAAFRPPRGAGTGCPDLTEMPLHSNLSWGQTMHLHIPLLAGTLKIKTYRFLRSSERARADRIFRLGGIYFVW